MHNIPFDHVEFDTTPKPKSGRRAIKKRITDSDLSTETRMLMKQMMRSSKLTFSQQRYLDSMVEESGSLPMDPPPIKQEIYKDAKRAAVSAEKHQWFHNPPSKRMFQTIKDSGDYEVSVYRTTPKKNMSEEKEKLQAKMEGITQEEFSDTLSIVSNNRRSSVKSPVEELDEIEMLKEEISDRRQWMADMMTLGKSDTYKRQIQSEIRLRQSRLDKLFLARK